MTTTAAKAKPPSAFIPRAFAHQIGDCRRLTKEEKRCAKRILHYPKDHVFKPLGARHGKNRSKDRI